MADRYDEELFLGYIEGDLTREQNIEFEKLLVQDARLRNLVAHLVIDRARLRHLPDEPAPPELMDRVHQQLERGMLLGPAGDAGLAAPARRLRLNRYLAYGSLAATLALGALIVIQTLNNPAVHQLASTQKPTHPAATVSSPRPAAIENPTTPPTQLAAAGNARAATQPSLNSLSDSALALGDSKRADAPSLASRPFESKLAMDSVRSPPATGLRNLAEAPASTSGALTATESEALSLAKKLDRLDRDQPPSVAAAPVLVPAEKSRAEHETPLLEPVTSRLAYEAAGLRLDAVFTSADAGEREVRAWAFRHDVPIESVVAEPQAGKDTGALADVNHATVRRLVLVIPTRQVADLVAFLNTQKGQSAGLTRPGDGPPVALAARGRREQMVAQDAPGRAVKEAATTQPADSAPGATTASGPPVDEHPRVNVSADSIANPGPNGPASGAETIMRLEVEVRQRDLSR